MPSAEDDVAVLVRLKAARDSAMASRQTWDVRRPQPRDRYQVQADTRSRWPAYMALSRELVESYERRAADLGIRVEVEELVRLRAWLPELAINITRCDGELGMQLLFKMNRTGRTFHQVRQITGRRRANLNRGDKPVEMSERNVRLLLRAIVHRLVVH